MARILSSFARLSAAVGFTFVLAATTACGGGKPEPKTASTESGSSHDGPATVGQGAPDLTIQTINGKGKISLEALKGKVVIVDFWATWCGPCKQSFPKYEELAKKHEGKLQIVAISVDDEQGGVAPFAKEQGVSFPIGWDENHKIADRWVVKSMPTSYILDSSGTVRYIHAGFHDDEPQTIAKELTALLSETPSSGGKSKTEVAAAVPASKDDDKADKKEEAKNDDSDPPPAAAPKKSSKKSTKKAPAKPKKKAQTQPSQ